jgi:hypothetical protein
MRIDDFREIDRYFVAKGKPIRLAHLAYATYIDNVESAIAAQGLTGRPLSDPTVLSVCQNYLTDMQLDALIVVTEKRAEADERRTSAWAQFGVDVLASLVSNIVFAIILFGLYATFVAPSDPAALSKALKQGGKEQVETPAR